MSYALEALVATLFTWSITAAGAGLVFIFKRPGKNLMDAMLGFAGGVMIAASFWSLLAPAIEMAENLGMISWLIAFTGFISGGTLLFLGDKLFDKIMTKEKISKKNNLDKCSLKRCLMLIFSITMHNIPEGMAIGVAFGALAYDNSNSAHIGACLLALGIGFQNFPEGTAISLPLRREGFSPKKAFLYGQLSGIVEPLSGFIGALLVMKIRMLLPFLLAFAAGAMIYVVVEEIIPESQTNEKKDRMAMFTLIGFSLMMILDTALG